MDKLYRTAKFYKEKLLGRRYLALAVKKGKFFLLEIYFNEDSFKHLCGLHKLDDLGLKKTPAEILFTQVLQKELTYDKITKSSNFSEIFERIENFEKIADILSSPEDMRKSLYGSFGPSGVVKADYLLSQKSNGKFLHLFFKENKEVVLPVTFFTHDSELYLRKNTTRWNIVDVEELTEKDDVKRKAELMELKAKLSTSTSRSFDEMREIVQDTVHIRSSNSKNNDKDEHDD